MSSTRARWGRSKERTEQNTRPMGWYQNPIILVHPDRAGIKPTRHSDFPVRRAGRPTAMRNITAFPAASGEKKSVTSSFEEGKPCSPAPEGVRRQVDLAAEGPTFELGGSVSPVSEPVHHTIQVGQVIEIDAGVRR